jgi:hypothetical protein
MIRNQVSALSASLLLRISSTFCRAFAVASSRCSDPTDLRSAADVEIGWGHALLDHLVGVGQQRGRDGEVEHSGGLEVDHQFEFGGLLDRQVARFGALENSVDVARRLSKLINGIRTV